MNWTKEQKQVINLRNKNLLVSAAAGSGKTAVLVERILSLVTDKEKPVDIDRLLVVTFTRAAAGEMKERIGRALEDRLQKDPDNVHLQKQGVLLHHAQINTIDGFCTFVLQNYFHRIDLDPGYGIAEEDDLKVMRGKVLEDLLEEEYAEGRESFRHFAEAYGTGKNDRKLMEMISRVYDFSVSSPDPDDWLDSCLEAYAPETEEELENSRWMQSLVREAGYRAEGLLQSAMQLRDFVMRHPEAPQPYLPALQSDVSVLADLAGKTSYHDFRAVLEEWKPEKLSGKKQPDVDPELKEQVKKQRTDLKDKISKLQKDFFSMSAGQILEELAVIRPQAGELVHLVRRFAAAFAAAKREKNKIDFPDLEHLALQILTEKEEDGTRRPTAAAEELAARFEEVMIDEYQDSNFLQEAILSAVSRQGEGTGDRFMVGDIKQSIYGFRQARPELFLQKMNAYRAADTQEAETCGDAGPEENSTAGVRIDLHQNFRSRSQVLETANALFSRLMVPELGGIVYDDAAALHAGADYPDPEDPSFPDTELLIIDKSAPEFDEDRSKAAMNEAEAHAAAGKIRACLRNGRLWDAGKKEFRPVQYRDCVILLRAAGTWGDTFVRVLRSEGIPAYAASGKGYFTTVEIATVMNYLRVCDNPLQDIPLAAVLRSPIGGMHDEELAQLRIISPQGPLLTALQKAADEAGGALGEKAARFLEQLKSFRERVPRTPVHVLIRQILKETGYGVYAAAMPAGEQRQANLEMLAERAAAYEKNDYHGLFQFVRYVEQLTEREVDFGEVSLYGEEENIVRVMTIHKSKGLEFPIVLLAGLGNHFNTQDEKSAVVLHAGLGLGMTAVFTQQRRIHAKTILRAAVQNAVRHDNLAEELRVLYVAVTRAREKLILIGTDSEREESLFAGEKPSYQQLISAGSYLDWILMAADSGVPFRKQILGGEQLINEEAEEVLLAEKKLQEIRGLILEGQDGERHTGEKDAGEGHTEKDGAGRFAPETRRILERIGAFRYKEETGTLPAKLTVTELKRRQSRQTAEEEQGAELFPEEPVVPYVPKFLGETETAKSGEEQEEALTGAARGTAYHHVLAVLDYDRISKIFSEGTPDAAPGADSGRVTEAVRQQILEMRENGLLSAAEYKAVRAEDIAVFLEDPLGRRMAEAAAAGTLRREQPFVLDLPASQIESGQAGARSETTQYLPQSGNSSKEIRSAAQAAAAERTVLIQGTIDAYWEEDGAYILADYKTDRIAPGEEKELAEKYRVQLEYYKLALEQITEIPVREMYIYAVTTGKSVKL